MPSVEDAWIHEDFLRDAPAQTTIPALKNTEGKPIYSDLKFETLLNYWRCGAEHSHLPRHANGRRAKTRGLVHDSPEQERFTVDGLLWHVMIHEMRDTAQIALAPAYARH